MAAKTLSETSSSSTKMPGATTKSPASKEKSVKKLVDNSEIYQQDGTGVVRTDPYLEPFKDALIGRYFQHDEKNTGKLIASSAMPISKHGSRSWMNMKADWKHFRVDTSGSDSIMIRCVAESCIANGLRMHAKLF